MSRYPESAGSHGEIHCELDLGRLPPPTHLYPYLGRHHFLDIYYRELDRFGRDQNAPDFVVFTGVDEKQFDEDFRNSSDKVVLHSISTYDPAKRVLFIKMTTHAHAQAIEGLGEELLDALRPRNLRLMLTSFAGQLLYGQGQNKKADKGWGPLDRPLHQGQRWPSLVVEVAVSETRTKLEADISFWLTRTFGQVKMVITVDVARTRHQRILLDKWVLDDNGQLHCAQQITLTKTSLQDRTPIIENGPLAIEFEALFLRPRQPGECNLVLDARLGIIAKKLWVSTTLS